MKYPYDEAELRAEAARVAATPRAMFIKAVAEAAFQAAYGPKAAKRRLPEADPPDWRRIEALREPREDW